MVTNHRKMTQPAAQPHQATPAIIDVRGLVKNYYNGANVTEALKGISFQVNEGEFVAVVGKSGAGKTSLINVISGLDRISAGEVWMAGTAVHTLNQDQAAAWRGLNVGIVFQSFNLLPGLTAAQNVMVPMDFAHWKTIRKRRERAEFLLSQMGLAEHVNKLPSAVSGGQAQRIGIARALATDPPIILADEPTGSLDSATRAAVMSVFEDLAAQGKTVVFVTHDRDLAQRAPRLIALSDGEIISDSANEPRRIIER